MNKDGRELPLPVVLRENEMTNGKKGAKVDVRGITGQRVRIRVRNLWESEKNLIFKAFSFIDEHLVDKSYRDPLMVAMHRSSFVITGSNEIGAYTQQVENGAIVILNQGLFKSGSIEKFQEFCVTICHELMHCVEIPDDDLDPASEREGRHDLLSYALLGLGIPRDHWAFRKFPHILKEFNLPVEE